MRTDRRFISARAVAAQSAEWRTPDRAIAELKSPPLLFDALSRAHQWELNGYAQRRGCRGMKDRLLRLALAVSSLAALVLVFGAGKKW